MSESVESYLARGGRVVIIPTGQGAPYPGVKAARGCRLREKIAAEADRCRERKAGVK